MALRRDPRRSRVRLPLRAAAGRLCAATTPYRISDPSSRRGFVLPLVQHSRRRAADAGDPGQAARARRARAADPPDARRSARRDALVTNFAGQWLFLRDLKSANPDSREFPDFDDNLRQAFQRETEMLFESIMREDRSVLDLLDADYTFVNERLARHYGIPNVYGPDFRRVPVPSDARRGLLGPGQHAARDLERESHFARAARQVDSGKPARQPAAAAAAECAAAQGESERRASRRRCASGWRSIARIRCAPAATKSWIPIGLALENFDGDRAAGAPRTAGVTIDASGQLVDGTPLDGPASLRKALLSRPDAFVGTMTREAADVRRRPRDEVLRYAGRSARSCARREPESLPVLRSGSGHREAPRFRCESKKVDGTVASARRLGTYELHHQKTSSATHVPARRWASLWRCRCSTRWSRRRRRWRKRPRRPKSRFCGIYVPHGATMDKWTPAHGRHGLRSSPRSLKPLEKYRDRVTVVSNLAHPPAGGVARTPAPITRARPRCS